jgi:hypothetical protein
MCKDGGVRQDFGPANPNPNPNPNHEFCRNTEGASNGLLNNTMDGKTVSIALAGAVREQANAELRRLAAEELSDGSVHSNISALLGSARCGSPDGDSAPLQLSAYISCVDCVKSDVYEVGGHVPLRVSDVVRTMGITGNRPISLFYLAKSTVL